MRLSAAPIFVTEIPVRMCPYASVDGFVLGVQWSRHPARKTSSGLPPLNPLGGSSRSCTPFASTTSMPFRSRSPFTVFDASPAASFDSSTW